MIHDVTPTAPAAPCGCHKAAPPARLGFTDQPTAAASLLTPDWHWLVIAALAAIVLFQAWDQPAGRKRK